MRENTVSQEHAIVVCLSADSTWVHCCSNGSVKLSVLINDHVLRLLINAITTYVIPSLRLIMNFESDTPL